MSTLASPDDAQSDVNEPDEPHHGIEAVEAALGQLTNDDLKAFMRIARNRAVGTDLDPGDLFDTTVERLLLGRRHWHLAETLAQCFARTFKSLVQDWWRRRAKNLVDTAADLDACCDDESGQADGVIESAVSDRPEGDPERSMIARQELQAVFEILKDDQGTLEVAVARANGDTPEEIRYAYDMTEKQYDSATKRIWRALQKHQKLAGRTS